MNKWTWLDPKLILFFPVFKCVLSVRIHFSIVLLHVIFGWPSLRQPYGFHARRAWLAIYNMSYTTRRSLATTSKNKTLSAIGPRKPLMLRNPIRLLCKCHWNYKSRNWKTQPHELRSGHYVLCQLWLDRLCLRIVRKCMQSVNIQYYKQKFNVKSTPAVVSMDQIYTKTFLYRADTVLIIQRN